MASAKYETLGKLKMAVTFKLREIQPSQAHFQDACGLNVYITIKKEQGMFSNRLITLFTEHVDF